MVYTNRYAKLPDAWNVMREEMKKDNTFDLAKPLIKELSWFEVMLLIHMLPKSKRLPEIIAGDRNTQIHQIVVTLSKLKKLKMIKTRTYRKLRIIEPTKKGLDTTIFILNWYSNILNRNFNWDIDKK